LSDINKGSVTKDRLIISALPLPEGTYPLPQEVIDEVMKTSKQNEFEKREMFYEDDDLEDEVELHFSIAPDDNIWTRRINYNNSLTFLHKRLDNVSFSITNYELDCDERLIYKDMLKEAIIGVGKTAVESTFQFGSIKWYVLSVDCKNGRSIAYAITERKSVVYWVDISSPTDIFEGAVEEIKRALETFEFTE